MGNILKMKSAAWGGLALMVVWLVYSFFVHSPWWGYISVFFAFMMVFCHLAALYVEKISSAASRKLDLLSFVMGVHFIVAIIIEAFFV